MAGTNALRKEAIKLSRNDLIDELQRPTGNWNEDVMRETLMRIYKIVTKKQQIEEMKRNVEKKK